MLAELGMQCYIYCRFICKSHLVVTLERSNGQFSSSGISSTTTAEEAGLSFIAIILTWLEEDVILAEKNVLLAAKHSPAHGLIMFKFIGNVMCFL